MEQSKGEGGWPVYCTAEDNAVQRTSPAAVMPIIAVIVAIAITHFLLSFSLLL